MFLTLSFQVADTKNDGGRTITHLSNRKKALLEWSAEAFSEAYRTCVQWGLAHWDELPFTFPLEKDGKPILDKQGAQKYDTTDAHYLANWLSSRVSLPWLLHSKLKNGARNQAAETLLSQWKLRKMEVSDSARLTGPVGASVPRDFRPIEHEDAYTDALTALQFDDGKMTAEDREALSQTMTAACKMKPLPLLFSGPSDFLLFRHQASGRVFVCLPIFAREASEHERFAKKLHPLVQKDKKSGKRVENLVPLRDGEDVHIPNSRQWLLLPLRRMVGEHRNAETLLTNPKVSPRSLELFERDGVWYCNIVVDTPEALPYIPETFLGVHIGFYKIFWTLVDKHGGVIRSDCIDLSIMQTVIERAARQRQYARQRMRTDRFPRYRARLKLVRERVVNALIQIAVTHRAAIGIEDLSGVNKKTRSRRLNLFRSHWDFGKYPETVLYKGIIAGVPMVGGRRKSVFTVFSYTAMFTCATCGATNVKKEESARPISLHNGDMVCAACNNRANVDENTARVIAEATRTFYARKQ